MPNKQQRLRNYCVYLVKDHVTTTKTPRKHKSSGLSYGSYSVLKLNKDLLWQPGQAFWEADHSHAVPQQQLQPPVIVQPIPRPPVKSTR